MTTDYSSELDSAIEVPLILITDFLFPLRLLTFLLNSWIRARRSSSRGKTLSSFSGYSMSLWANSTSFCIMAA